MDGVEVYKPYITELHQYVYDNIYIGNALDVVPKLGEYDLVYLGDVIEHFDKDAGAQLLRACLEKARMCVIVSTPLDTYPQGALNDNPNEVHVSLWERSDFLKLGRVRSVITDDGLLLCAIAKDGGRLPSFGLVGRSGLWARVRPVISSSLLIFFDRQTLRRMRQRTLRFLHLRG